VLVVIWEYIHDAWTYECQKNELKCLNTVSNFNLPCVHYTNNLVLLES